MKYFVLYPSVYTRSTTQGIILYDTYTESKLLFIGNEAKSISTIENCTILVTDENSTLITQLFNNNWGYYINSCQAPVNITSVNFTSSKAKIAESSKIHDGGNSVSYIDKISFFIDPVNDANIDTRILNVLDFPVSSINDKELEGYYSLLKSETFPNLKEIEIVSCLSERALEFATELLKLNYLITFRTVITQKDQIAFPTIEKFNNVFFKLFAKANLIPFFSQERFNNTSLSFWSESRDEILNHSSHIIIPIIYDREIQPKLSKEVLLDLNDILAIKKTNYELKYHSLFNSTFMGTIKLKGKYVLIGNQVICSISEFKDGFSNSLFNSENLWFFSRRKKSTCKECVFADLCPSVSLIEVLNVIERPCSLNFNTVPSPL